MNSQVPETSVDGLLPWIGGVDAVDLTADELVRPTAGAVTARGHALRQARRDGGRRQTVLHGPDSEPLRAFPAGLVGGYRAAAQAAAVARRLVAAGPATLSVLGDGLGAQLQVAMLTAHVPDVSHVAVGAETSLTPGIRANLALAGVGLQIARRPHEAAFGANLVVRCAADAAPLPHQPCAGATVIDVSGQQLTEATARGADRVYVDEPGHISGDAAFAHTRASLVGEAPAGALPIRSRHDEVVLVSLSRGQELDVSLALLIHRSMPRIDGG